MDGASETETNDTALELPENATCCGNCVFWILTHKRGKAGPLAGGQCRASPPVPLMKMMQMPLQPDKMVQVVEAYFPTTAENMWCGAYDDGVPIDTGENATAR